jgi:predicted Zn finger-like uncharacterized protein
MYTRCPECHTAFRISANHLQQAAGRVRCGRCGSAFDALTALSEHPLRPLAGPTATAAPELCYDDPRGSEPEWPECDGHAADEAPIGPYAAESLQPPTRDDYDGDDTGTFLLLDSMDSPQAGPPQSETALPPGVAEATGEDWIMAEVKTTAGWGEEAWSDESWAEDAWAAGLAMRPASPADAGSAAHVASSPATAGAEHLEDTLSREVEALIIEDPDLTGNGLWTYVAPEPEEPEVDPEGAETARDIEHSLESAAEREQGLALAAAASHLSGAAVPLAVTQLEQDDAGTNQVRRWLAGLVAALLLMALTAQAIHHFRDDLAIQPHTAAWIERLYGALGQPLYPAWPLEDYQLRARSDALLAGDQQLEIAATLGNRGQRSLPLPLIRLTLLDRWGETLGSRVLRPDEYFAGDPRRRLSPGAEISAALSVLAPPGELYGYRLDVCRHLAADSLRCDTQR